MKKMIIGVAGLIIIALGIYGFTVLNGNQDNTDSGSNTAKTDAVEIKQLVADYSAGKLEAKSASINSRQLIVTNSDESQVTYDLPKDEFFVSIAPYFNQTHPCAVHNLVSCRGELANEEFEVLVEDETGQEIINQKMKSQGNGFIDLWLPRDKKYVVTIKNNGNAVQSELSTFENDNTCVTTMQFQNI